MIAITHNVMQLYAVCALALSGGKIAYRCCYKLVRIYSTELDLKYETFFFSFFVRLENKNLK
jgi:hypothetical protein